MKVCTKCGELKDFTEFYRDKTKKNGLRPECRFCQNLYRRTKLHEYTRTYTRNYNKTEKYKKYSRERYKNDIDFRIRRLLRNRIRLALRNNQKTGHTLEILGCTIQEFKLYLEKQFSKDMSWENQGTYWEIDHIVPCANFDLSNFDEQKKCFHYSNMQPLTVSDNRSKRNKIL